MSHHSFFWMSVTLQHGRVQRKLYSTAIVEFFDLLSSRRGSGQAIDECSKYPVKQFEVEVALTTTHRRFHRIGSRSDGMGC